jgi:hypothetical protein
MNENELLKKSLMNFWNEIITMSLDESKKLCAEFCSKCIKTEFQNKFLTDFESKKPITIRYFNNIRPISLDDDIYDQLAITGQYLDVQVFWGKIDDPIAFHLKGRTSKFGNIFVTDGDAFAKIANSKKEHFLFLDGHRGDFFVVY